MRKWQIEPECKTARRQAVQWEHHEVPASATGALAARHGQRKRARAERHDRHRITDELRKLRDDYQFRNLFHEVEARWRLVETAWELSLPRAALTVEYVPETGLLIPDSRRYRRPNITGARDALNGYQKGKCFYCFAEISIDGGADYLADVDHFFPHSLKAFNVAEPVDGVWNLVLACQRCNRGVSGKFDRLPSLRYLERLSTRNDFLIESHHPLKETLIQQTGATEAQRHAFLQQAFTEAQQLLIHTWAPVEESDAAF